MDSADIQYAGQFLSHYYRLIAPLGFKGFEKITRDASNLSSIMKEMIKGKPKLPKIDLNSLQAAPQMALDAFNGVISLNSTNTTHFTNSSSNAKHSNTSSQFNATEFPMQPPTLTYVKESILEGLIHARPIHESIAHYDQISISKLYKLLQVIAVSRPFNQRFIGTNSLCIEPFRTCQLVSFIRQFRRSLG